MKSILISSMVATAAVGSLFAGSGAADKPTGFRFFDNHLTIRPYVSLSYTYDSNFDTTKHSEGDSLLGVEPGATFEWKGERWTLTGNLYYRYNYYCQYNDTMGESSYGESLNYQTSVGEDGARGWSLMLGERYDNISQADSLNSGDGRGIWRDRERIDVSGAVERRFSDRWHAGLSGQYDWIDYKNDTGKYAPLYGWSEYALGADAGYAASKWTDLLVSAGYTRYLQQSGHSTAKHYSNNSDSWSVMGGVGTRATEKITYRLMVGASSLNYAGSSNTDCSWTYSLSANWRATRQLQFSAVGSSYYQPSERSLGTATQNSTLSLGSSYLTLGDRVTFTADVSLRHEECVYHDATSSSDYDEDLLSLRFGANYTMNRWMSFYANVTWEEEWADKKSDYDYDRFRGTIGVRFHY